MRGIVPFSCSLPLLCVRVTHLNTHANVPCRYYITLHNCTITTIAYMDILDMTKERRNNLTLKKCGPVAVIGCSWQFIIGDTAPRLCVS